MSERTANTNVVPKAQSTFPRPKYVRDLRDLTNRHCEEEFRAQEGECLYSLTDSAVVHRRAFVLSLFNIFMAEATEIIDAPHLKSAYPKALLPFKELGKSTLSAHKLKLKGTQLHSHSGINCYRDTR